MTREEFQLRLMAARGLGSDDHDHVFEVVREGLRGMDDAQQFEILFPVAVKHQTDAPSYPAAQLLRELSPNCPLSCEEAVRALLPEWDVSIEEDPLYLAARFGAARVRQAILQIESGITSDLEKQTLKTIAYWLESYDRVYPKST